EESTDALLSRLRQVSDQRKTLTELDRRILDCQQLAAVYKNWGGLIRLREGDRARLLLHSLALVFGVLLIAVFVEAGIHRFFHSHKDKRRAHQQRFLISLAVRLS